MNLQLTLNLVSIICSTKLLWKVQGLSLIKSAARSCLGEEVIFTCTITEGSSLSWSVIVTRDSNIPALTHTFSYHHFGVQSNRMITWSQVGFRIELELVSIEPTLVSMLAANLTDIIIDAGVTCEQSFPEHQVQRDHFSLASVPSTPVQIIDIDYNYECINFNVSLSWIPPYGNHQIDYYQLRIGGQSRAIVDDTSFIFNSLPYFENITIEVAVVNCAGVGAESTVVITRGGCFERQILNSSEKSCIKPAGYQTIIECEPGKFPKEITSTCQADGSWIPDAMECSVGCHIPSFSHNTTTIITNDEARVNVLTNYTIMGSEIQVFCGNQTNQDGTGPTFIAVCEENGTWLPDLSGHKCATDQDSSDIQPRRYSIYIIIGACTGCGTILLFMIMCGFVCSIWKLCKKQRHNVEQIDSLYLDPEFQHKLGELNHDTNIPQYETISPLYEIIPENIHHSETYLKMMNNNAYCESAKCIL